MTELLKSLHAIARGSVDGDAGAIALLRCLPTEELQDAYRRAKANETDKGHRAARLIGRELIRRNIKKSDEQLRERLEAIAGRKCLPEGELHVVWMIEQTFDATRQAYDYVVELKHIIAPVPPRGLVGDFRFVNATWQQRAEAIINVKGEYPPAPQL